MEIGLHQEQSVGQEEILLQTIAQYANMDILDSTKMETYTLWISDFDLSAFWLNYAYQLLVARIIGPSLPRDAHGGTSHRLLIFSSFNAPSMYTLV